MMHEGLIQIFRNRPALAVEVLRDLLHAEIPAFSTIQLEELDPSEIKLSQYKPDLIVLLLDGTPVHAIVIETQLGAGSGRARGRQPGSRGCGALCCRPWSGRARICNRQGMMAAADGLDEDRKALYTDLVYISVGEAVRKALEAMMNSGYEFQSDFAKTYFGRGRDEGRAEGEAVGEARAVLLMLKARGFAVSDEVRQRMLACKDIAQLDRWAERAATVNEAAELFLDYLHILVRLSQGR